MDLRHLIKSLLQVQAASRPNCQEILEMSNVEKRIRKYFSDNDGNTLDIMEEQPNYNKNLLSTIKVASNLYKCVLPPSAYEKVHSNFTTMPGTTKGILKRGESNNSQASVSSLLDEQKLKPEKIKQRTLLT